MCAIFNETRDVDECITIIQTLYPHIIALRPKIAEAAREEDVDKYKGIARIFAEAGEAWVVLIARMPVDFRVLVESILDTAALD
jgi:transportin-3